MFHTIWHIYVIWCVVNFTAYLLIKGGKKILRSER